MFKPFQAAVAWPVTTAGRVAAAAGIGIALALSGCAQPAIDANFRAAQAISREQLGAELQWLDSDSARQQAQARVDELLAKPLQADDAVRIALAYSPALQALLYESAAQSAAHSQSLRLPNPVFSFERLVRDSAGGPEREFGRVLSLSVLDLLMLPSRWRWADHQQQTTRLQLSGQVMNAALQARQAWVQAVAAQQALRYAEQVKSAAEAGAELARRMQAVGNFSRLQRAREQEFSAQAMVQLARAQQAQLSQHEALVRALGLSAAQARALTLPDRLPDLPGAPRDAATLTEEAIEQRLDWRIARAQLEFIAHEQGLNRVGSVIDGATVGIARHSETGQAPQKGFELSLPLPVFDGGDASRTQADARYQAAVQRSAQLALEAGSQLRERHGAYLSAYELARHYRDEIVPLRKTIADENLLRYNGMLISVFELIADAREQATSVMQAIDAQRDFWLADAQLQAALIGPPAIGGAWTGAEETSAR